MRSLRIPLLLNHGWMTKSLNVATKSKHNAGCLAASFVRSYYSDDLELETKKLPQNARVVVCGGGIIGCSVAYHLAEAGWTDTVLLEQGRVTSGTTWHSSGLVSQLKSNLTDNKLAGHSVELYKKLQLEGSALGWKECGSVNVARTKDRMTMFKRLAAIGHASGIECHIITPQEAAERAPIIDIEGLEGGVWIPGDGVVNPTDLTYTLQSRAKQKGVQFFEKCQVERVQTAGNKVSGVETSLGDIKCEYFINCAGQWSRQLGQLSEPAVRVPLHSCEHYYVVTKPLPDLSSMLPVIRDYDGRVYFREWSGGLMAGGFEQVAKPIFHDGVPSDLEFELLPEDWDHFQVLLEQILVRIPAMRSAEVRSIVSGPESFTPDGKMIFGKSPEVENYFVATGMCGGGVSAGGGVGQRMAELVMNGHSSLDMWPVDIQRFVDLHNNKKFLKDRVTETLGTQAAISYPDVELNSSRKLRTSPLYTRLEARGGVFGQSMGFERALYFKEVHDDEYFHMETPPMNSYNKPHWFDLVANEYWACKEAVCVIDMSSFSKIDLKSAGSEVVDFLQYLCSNDIDKPVGTVIHTGMQNDRGGYENDCSVVRLDDYHFLMISPTSQQTRCIRWLTKHQPASSCVLISNVTSMYTCINLIGPRARELLAELSDVSTKAFDFPQMTSKTINVGNASGIMAMRLTHSGEDGFSLFIPSECALHVYDALMLAGQDYGIQNAGYYALRSLRLEKFFAYWGQDLTAFTNPFECQREFRTKLNSDKDFIGKQALLNIQKHGGVEKKFVQLFVDANQLDGVSWPWGGEPLYRNGVYAGMTTSGAYGYGVNSHVCLGYVYDIDSTTGERKLITNDFVTDHDASYEIDIAGKRYPCQVGLYAPKIGSSVHDPFVPTRMF